MIFLIPNVTGWFVCTFTDLDIKKGSKRNFVQIDRKIISNNKHIKAETNGRHFPDDIFKCIFLNENVLISIKSSLKFVPNGQINNIPALV